MRLFRKHHDLLLMNSTCFSRLQSFTITSCSTVAPKLLVWVVRINNLKDQSSRALWALDRGLNAKSLEGKSPILRDSRGSETFLFHQQRQESWGIVSCSEGTRWLIFFWIVGNFALQPVLWLTAPRRQG